MSLRSFLALAHRGPSYGYGRRSTAVNSNLRNPNGTGRAENGRKRDIQADAQWLIWPHDSHQRLHSTRKNWEAHRNFHDLVMEADERTPALCNRDRLWLRSSFLSLHNHRSTNPVFQPCFLSAKPSIFSLVALGVTVEMRGSCRIRRIRTGPTPAPRTSCLVDVEGKKGWI
ncbi:hypothetical protein B0H34DRAFT_733119 [Crassisporium funariophilum]|nr:hypothetical protein B0H34DRAFT_733119 [Crassisporium funariophilum]